MGADLYRQFNNGKEVPILGFERSKRAIDSGYFRDAYNSGSILNKYGLSWWVDISKLQDKEGIIKTAKVKKFRTMLDDEILETNIASENTEGKEYFRESAKLLKDYLDAVIRDKD